MRALFVAAVLLLVKPAHAFVPARADVSCPRAAMQGAWIAYAHTLDGAEVNAHDRVRFAPGRLDVALGYGPKLASTILYEVDKLPAACVGTVVRYEIFDMTWDFNLVSNDELMFRSFHPEKGTHEVRLRRVLQ